MSNQLEQFIRDHREEFDSEEPSRKLWDQVEVPARENKEPEVKVVRFQFFRWSAAAAVLILIAGSIWYFNKPRSNDLPVVATRTEQPAKDSQTREEKLVPVDSNQNTLAHQETEPQKESGKEVPTAEDDAKAEMAHYASLVEIKHRQLKAIEKDEPLLYKQFAGDVNKLDSVYNTLKRQLPNNPNREQLLEAMIQNLQLQMGLLNHQLEIIKKINQSKKSAYEKAYKSV